MCELNIKPFGNGHLIMMEILLWKIMQKISDDCVSGSQTIAHVVKSRVIKTKTLLQLVLSDSFVRHISQERSQKKIIIMDNKKQESETTITCYSFYIKETRKWGTVIVRDPILAVHCRQWTIYYHLSMHYQHRRCAKQPHLIQMGRARSPLEKSRTGIYNDEN